jgi:mono/diheme cytochrome c family protein
MKSKFFLTCCLLVISFAPAAVNAQQGNSAPTPAQAQGARLFKQRCGLCHLLYIVGKVDGQTAVMKGRMIGPMLTREKVMQEEAAVRQQIVNGGERMPGFQYALTPTQISAIIEYLKTIEKPTQVAYAAGSGDDDN